ncbi:MAG TPA: YfhO family protein [Pyrinomonadaceae bacterium]|nr:YfhO family protein [Pyrinomonadaceae bacterium]
MSLRDTDGWLASRLRGRGADAAAMLCIACFFALFFGWILFGDRYVIGGDAYAYSYPLRSVAWEMIKDGQLPLWTPYLLSGYPLLSMAQLALGYPLTWGYLFLDAPRAEQFYILAPFLLTPAFTYAYLRELGRSRLAALLAGLSFAYGGAMTGLLGVIGFPNNALMWLPLMLLAVERARRTTTRGGFASCLPLAAGAYAMSVLNGYAQGFLYVGLVALAYAVFISLFVERSGASAAGADADGLNGWQRLRRRWRPLAVAVCGIAAGAGVGAFQILETMRAARRSIRSTLIYPLFVSGSFSPRVALDSLVAPLYTGRFADVGTYVAPLVLLLALAGVLFAFKTATTSATTSAAQADARDVRVFFWAAAALVSCVFILGKHTPIYGWLYHVPVVNSFRVPSRFSYVWTFAASVLSAYGWDALALTCTTTATSAHLTTATRTHLTTATRAHLATATRARLSSPLWNFALVAALAVLSALAALLWWRQIVAFAVTDVDAATGVPRAWIEGYWYAGLPVSKYLAWKAAFTILTALLIWRGRKIDAARTRGLALAFAVLLVCFVEPFFVVAEWWPPFAKSVARLDTPSHVTRLLQARQADEPALARSRVYTRVNLFAEEFKESPRFDPQNVTALYRLENVGGYEPLLLERYSRALGNVNLDAANPLPGSAPNRALFDARSHVLDLLGARFVVNVNMSQANAPPVETELDAVRWSVIYDADNVRVLENRRALPRAWLVGAAESVDGEEALRRIGGVGEKEFDPRRTALMEVALAEMPALSGGELAPGSAEARITVYEPNRLVVETRAAQPTALVVAEIFYPGWEATVDGAPARIHLTNFIMRGVAVPAGAHRVEMRYRAPAARNGAIISALTLMLLTGLAFRARAARGLKRV